MAAAEGPWTNGTCGCVCGGFLLSGDMTDTSVFLPQPWSQTTNLAQHFRDCHFYTHKAKRFISPPEHTTPHCVVMTWFIRFCNASCLKQPLFFCLLQLVLWITGRQKHYITFLSTQIDILRLPKAGVSKLF